MFELTYSGIGSSTGETANRIRKKLTNKYNFMEDFIQNILIKKVQLENGEKKQKYFRGYRATFSSYFRNIHITIEFVHKDKHLSVEEKYDLMQILRAQLSNSEQAIIAWYFLSWQTQNDKKNERLNKGSRENSHKNT